MALDNPGLGVGLNMYKTLHHKYFDARTSEDVEFPHNTFLQVGAEVGLPALIVWMSLWIVAGCVFWLVIRRRGDGGLRHDAICIFCGLIAVAIFAAAHNALLNQLLWSLLALSNILYALAVNGTGREQAALHVAPEPVTLAPTQGEFPHGTDAR
jgi:O-antigen ligase